VFSASSAPSSSDLGYTPSPWELDSRGCLNFQWENDAFSLRNIDGHYTNGLRLSYLTAEDDIWSWVKKAARAVPFYPETGRLRASYAIGQSLFTPDNIKIAEPIPDDRPYAGWLYAAVGLVADNDESLDVTQLSVGVVGPAAQGEPVQKWIHEVIGSPEPQGWANQLHNELTIQFTYSHLWRVRHLLRGWAFLEKAGLDVDFTPHVEAALGNVFIYGSAGGSARFGNDLPADYGAPRIQPSLPGSEFFVPSRGFSWYVFLGLEGRVVARNMFLDGNTFKDSMRVQKNPLVGDLQTGLAITIRSTRLAFIYVVRTKEFETQNQIDRFGALTVSVRL
jgi:hypothetical protein